ncbi:MAG: DNA polymerase [bacterium]|nr:DNA polymerase [bacterium]
MQIGPYQYRQVWVADFEFSAPDGENPNPVCLVAHDLVSHRIIRIWEDELKQMERPPYDTGPHSLFVAYYASAELGCHLALNWPLPGDVLDLYVEFRNMTNGLPLPCGAGLLGAAVYYGLSGAGTLEKEEMRELAIRGGPWTRAEQTALLDYCESDVAALAQLLLQMMPNIDLPRALLRGRYMKAAARMENTGVPIDTESLGTLRSRWTEIQDGLIGRINAHYGVFEGRTFKRELFARWLATNNIPWPRLESGTLALDDDTFREMARAHPAVAPLRELRVSLSQLRLNKLAVGSDGRNRCLLSAFRAKTGRNQPSNAKFIFGPAVWLRSLIRPDTDHGLAYIDWSQQEVGIAAALSGDANMMKAYHSGDPYLEFGKQAGVIPEGGTRQAHSHLRDQFKACVLAVQYGMGERSLAYRIDQDTAQARELLRMHHETYPTFWRWSDAAVDHAMITNTLHTVFGWTVHTGHRPNPRSLRNFPMQANGAEMLRLACCLATEQGVRICAPVHDAVLIEAPLSDLDTAIQIMQQAMEKASDIVLGGFRLRSDVKTVRWPDRYMDERGRRMWETIQEVLADQSAYAVG